MKCYHGVNEGSLFPLKQGLLFMKPALFLPRSNIEEVLAGLVLDDDTIFFFVAVTDTASCMFFKYVCGDAAQCELPIDHTPCAP